MPTRIVKLSRHYIYENLETIWGFRLVNIEGLD